MNLFVIFSSENWKFGFAIFMNKSKTTKFSIVQYFVKILFCIRLFYAVDKTIYGYNLSISTRSTKLIPFV